MLVGDTHGSPGFDWADLYAQEEGHPYIIQVGDFYAYDVDPVTSTTFIPGNHEDWKRIALGNYPGPVSMYDAGETLTLDGWTFGFVGRIQKTRWHLENYYRVGGNEMIWIEQDAEELAERLDGTDILITHDAPLKAEDTLYQVNKMVEPDLHVHGHMHRYMRQDIGDCPVIGLPPCDLVHFPGRHEWGTALFDTTEGVFSPNKLDEADVEL